MEYNEDRGGSEGRGVGRADERREALKEERGACSEQSEVWRGERRGEEAIMMLTLLLRGSRSESCQLQATLAGGWDAAGMPLGMLTPPDTADSM